MSTKTLQTGRKRRPTPPGCKRRQDWGQGWGRGRAASNLPCLPPPPSDAAFRPLGGAGPARTWTQSCLGIYTLYHTWESLHAGGRHIPGALRTAATSLPYKSLTTGNSRRLRLGQPSGHPGPPPPPLPPDCLCLVFFFPQASSFPGFFFFPANLAPTVTQASDLAKGPPLLLPSRAAE